jgi:Uma2 family endonuclease
MQFTIKDAWLPATLTAPAMTDADFAAVCARYPELVFETTGEGKLVVMKPAVRNEGITSQLQAWAQSGTVFDSSAAFVLPNGARRGAHTAWSARTDVNGSRFCPDFVIEVRSPRDKLSLLRDKMLEYIENGAQLAWLIDPERKVVEILRPNSDVEVREGLANIEGGGPVAGFVLDLSGV